MGIGKHKSPAIDGIPDQRISKGRYRVTNNDSNNNDDINKSNRYTSGYPHHDRTKNRSDREKTAPPDIDA